jgi:uncharacterized protein YyaL (SSP411 family)
MTPYLASRAVLGEQRDRFDEIMAKLRKAVADTTPKYSGDQQLDVTGFTVARLIDAARSWGHAERMAKAKSIYSTLELYRAANDVVHTLAEDRRSDASLVDYLAYSDAALSEYLATGDVASLDNGKEVLRRGLYLFRGRRLGEFKMSNTDPGIPTLGDEAPEVVDDVEESCTAQLIRLCQTYSRLFLDSDARAVKELSDAANSATNLFAPIVGEMGPIVSGYYCATARVRDSAFVVVVGLDSVATANSLASRLAARVVAPAVGPIRPDLQQRGAGVYIVRDGSIEGPMRPDAAVVKLGSCLQLGLGRP